MSRPPRPRALVYGRNPVREALRGRRRVLEIVGTDRGIEALGPLPAGTQARRTGFEELERLAESPDHQGVVALVEPYRYADADELAARERPLIIALDEITDPQNLGAIARSAECVGATGLVIPRHRSAEVTPAVCKASAGAVEHLEIAVVTNLADWIERVKGPSLWAWAAAGDAAMQYTQADLADGAILVIGAEGKGVRPRVRKACDGALRLPLLGRIESLNASVAAAVLLYEARRQRDAAARA